MRGNKIEASLGVWERLQPVIPGKREMDNLTLPPTLWTSPPAPSAPRFEFRVEAPVTPPIQQPRRPPPLVRSIGENKWMTGLAVLHRDSEQRRVRVENIDGWTFYVVRSSIAGYYIRETHYNGELVVAEPRLLMEYVEDPPSQRYESEASNPNSDSE